jgi:hypothetical protein
MEKVMTIFAPIGVFIGFLLKCSKIPIPITPTITITLRSLLIFAIALAIIFNEVTKE